MSSPLRKIAWAVCALVVLAGGFFAWHQSDTASPLYRLDVQRSHDPGLAFELRWQGNDLVLNSRMFEKKYRVTGKVIWESTKTLKPDEQSKILQILKRLESTESNIDTNARDGSLWDLRSSNFSSVKSFSNPPYSGPADVYALGALFWSIAEVPQPKDTLY